MRFDPAPNAPVRQKAIVFQGGLDLVSPTLAIKPGTCIGASNFLSNVNGGYRRIGGYERFDGRPRPSDAWAWTMDISQLTAVNPGDVLTGPSGSATVVEVVSATKLVVSELSGTINVGETLSVGGVPSVIVVLLSAESGDGMSQDIRRRNVAADARRALITAVPGEGPVRGIHYYKGNLYAWRDNVGATELKMYKSSASGWTAVSTGVTLAPGGRVFCIVHNFTGALNAEKMYGADGKNKAFQFDGTTYTQITTTASPETPSLVIAHKNRLFATVLGNLFLSSPGDPVSGWAGVGATPAEIATGQIITGLVSMPGDGDSGALAVYGENKVSVLYGYSTSTWQMSVASPEVGALLGTTQYASTAIAVDNKSITTLAAVQEFGNFASSDQGRKVKPIIASTARQAVASLTHKAQNQYWVFFSDKSGLAVSIENKAVREIMPFALSHEVLCAFSGEDENGEERLFFGSIDGMVYEMERGTTFDGGDIEAELRLAFTSPAGPTTHCSWRRLRLDMNVPEYAEIKFNYEFDYGGPDYVTPTETGLTGGGGYWDMSFWDDFVWDSPWRSPPSFKMTGNSMNVSPFIYSKSKLSSPFVLESAVIDYSPRRIDRRA